MKILVVDDSSMMRIMVMRAMRHAGFGDNTFIEAADGEEAWELIQKNSPELVLADWHMPKVTGLELLERIHQAGLKIHVGLVTNEATPAMRRSAKDAGAQFVISKPVTSAVFRKVLGAGSPQNINDIPIQQWLVALAESAEEVAEIVLGFGSITIESMRQDWPPGVRICLIPVVGLRNSIYLGFAADAEASATLARAFRNKGPEGVLEPSDEVDALTDLAELLADGAVMRVAGIADVFHIGPQMIIEGSVLAAPRQDRAIANVRLGKALTQLFVIRSLESTDQRSGVGPATILLPTAESVGKVIGTMLNKKVVAKRLDTVHLNTRGRGVIGVYTQDDGTPAVVAFADMDLVTRVGGAGGMIPAATAQSASLGIVPEHMLRNFDEALNVLARTLNRPGFPHLVLGSTHRAPPLPKGDILQILEDPGQRLSLELDIEDYGKGRITMYLPK